MVKREIRESCIATTALIITDNRSIELIQRPFLSKANEFTSQHPPVDFQEDDLEVQSEFDFGTLYKGQLTSVPLSKSA